MNRRIIFSAVISGTMAIGLVSSAMAEPATPAKAEPSKTVAKAEPIKKELKPQTTCPVMGGAIDKKQFVDVNGKRIYVCCPGCIAEVKKDPDKYIKKLADMGQDVETITPTKAVKETEKSATNKADTSKKSSEASTKTAGAGY